MVPILHLNDPVVSLFGGGNNAGQPRREPRPPTLYDIAKLENDEIVFTELVYGVP